MARSVRQVIRMSGSTLDEDGSPGSGLPTVARGEERPRARQRPLPSDDLDELHRLLIESVQDYAIFALDPDGFILSWNAGAERFKGYKAAEVVGRHFSIFYPQERIDEGFPDYELREAARTGRFEDEGWRLRKDGSRFWANVVITALRDQSGTLVGYAKVTRDLSDRRAAEEALRLSEERFRLLVHSVQDYAIFMLDPDGKVATWNEGAERIRGYTADEIIGRHFSVFYSPEQVSAGFPQHELALAAKNGRFEDEGWRLRKNGSRFWANVVITALRNPDGELLGFAKITRDLTERRDAEQQAIAAASRFAAEEAARQAADEGRERAEQLQRLTSALSGAYSIPDVREVILKEGLTELGAEGGALALLDERGKMVEVIGQIGYAGATAIPPRWPLDERRPITEAIRTNTVIVCRSRADRDARFPAATTVLAAFETTVAIPLLHRGRAIGALAMHWRTSTPTPDDLALLSAFALQCSQSIERARLYGLESQARMEAEEARRRADEANRSKSDFLAAMSHELRTPLNAIGGYVQLLLLGVRGQITDEQRGDLERVQRSQQHLLSVINDLLNFSRLEAGKVEYSFADVAVTEVLESVRQMIAPQASAKDLAFRVVDRTAGARVSVDRPKLEQILLNLLSNAVKFTAGGGEVVLETWAEAPRAIIQVRDTGTGIPDTHLERIFEPFVQVGRTPSSAHEGTGLGLAISRDLARAMSGDITVTSTVGEGSTFTLSLPLA
jgi:PAS domain S-box-containing protein